MSAIALDQASGLRARVAGSQPPPVPVLYADFVLFRGAQVQLPPTTLVWHWRPRVAPPSGGTLQDAPACGRQPHAVRPRRVATLARAFPAVAAGRATLGAASHRRCRLPVAHNGRRTDPAPANPARLALQKPTPDANNSRRYRARRRAATPAVGAFQVSFGVPHGGSGKSTGQPARRRLRTANPVGDGVPACYCCTRVVGG
jgi:hypothetical protein